MTKRIVIHAGSPKTATTSIQYGCIRRRDELLAQGILFPVVETLREPGLRNPAYSDADQGDAFEYADSAHGSLFWSHRKRHPPSFERYAILPALREEWEHILDGFFAGPAHTLIISAEILFFEHKFNGLEDMMPRLRGHRTDLVIGLRHPEPMLHALYAQIVKSKPRSVAPAATFHAVSRYLDGGYEALIESLVDTVKPSNLILYWMKDLFADGRSAMGGFLRIIGADIGIDQEFVSNSTPDPDVVLLLRMLNRRGADWTANKEIVEACESGGVGNSLPRTHSVFPEGIQRKMNRRFQLDLPYLERHGLPPSSAPKAILLEQMRELSPEQLSAVIDRLQPKVSAKTSATLQRLRDVPARSVS
jgi:hypothetical protein